VVFRIEQPFQAAAPAHQIERSGMNVYVPTDAKGVPLIALCACCRRDVVTSANNMVGTQYVCRHCRERAQARAA